MINNRLAGDSDSSESEEKMKRGKCKWKNEGKEKFSTGPQGEKFELCTLKKILD